MSQQEIIALAARALEEAGIDFMVTGSVASSLQGEPRSTHDIDLVVQVAESEVDTILSLFPASEYDVSADAIRDTIRRGSMFNVVSLTEGDKLDFWLLTDEPFDQSRFARRRSEHAFGVDLPVSAPEDTLLMKLSWGRRSAGSEKQHTDALRVQEVPSGTLDETYLDHRAKILGVEAELGRVRSEARSIE